MRAGEEAQPRQVARQVEFGLQLQCVANTGANQGPPDPPDTGGFAFLPAPPDDR